MSDTQGKEEFSSVEDLLSADLNDLADLPAFEAPPPGAYVLGIKMDAKEVNKKDAVEARFRVIETVELEDKSGETPQSAPGTEFSVLYFLDNKFGVGNLKKDLAPYAEHFGTTNIGALIRDNLKEEVTITATISNKADKTDPEKIYARVHNVQVA